MQFLILLRNPRKQGNMISLVEPFVGEIKESGNDMNIIWLYGKRTKGRIACRGCQKDWTRSGYSTKDGMQEIFDAILKVDKIILAVPTRSWSCSAPMEAVPDRLVCDINKYHGDKKGSTLWDGKNIVMITTCECRPEKGADLFEEGVKRCCKHSQSVYEGILSKCDLGYRNIFIDNGKKERARAFARNLL